MTREISRESEFYLDETLDGSAMREQMVRFYNMLAYWSSRSSVFDAKKKTLQSMLDQVKDRAKFIRSQECGDKKLKALLQDAYIRDIWDVEVAIDDEVYTAKMIQDELTQTITQDNEAKANMSLCQTAVDICRSALSWDKQELSKLA